MFKTRIQTTDIIIGDHESIGAPELVPIHPLGDEVFARIRAQDDDSLMYKIETEDGTLYEWHIACCLNMKTMDAEITNCVRRTEGERITMWEEPLTIGEVVNTHRGGIMTDYHPPHGICAQYKKDGSIIIRRGPFNYQYSPKNVLVDPIQGDEWVSSAIYDEDYDY